MSIPFHIGGAIYGALLIVFGVACWLAPKRWPELWRSVPRDRWIGGAVALMCIAWSVKLLAMMLEDWTRLLLSPVIYFGLTAVLTVACILLLDYLLTRALAGLIVLVANWAMGAAFIEHAPSRWLLAISCYLLATVALYLVAEPYRFRDLLRALPQRRDVCAATVGVLTLCGLISLVTALASHAR